MKLSDEHLQTGSEPGNPPFLDARLATDRPGPLLRCDRTAGNPLQLGFRAETEHGFGGRAPSEQHSEGDVLSRIGRHADSARRRMDLEPLGESSGCGAEGPLALDSGGRVASRGDGQRGLGCRFVPHRSGRRADRRASGCSGRGNHPTSLPRVNDPA